MITASCRGSKVNVNIVNCDNNRKLKEAQTQFSEDFFKEIETSKEKWKFIQKKIGKKNNSSNITEIDENG